MDALRILGVKGSACHLGGVIAHLHCNTAWWWGISYDMKDDIAHILVIISR